MIKPPGQDLPYKRVGQLVFAVKHIAPFKTKRPPLELNFIHLVRKLEKIEVNMNSRHAHKTKLCYLLGVRFNILDDHPRHFKMKHETSPGIKPN